MKRQSFLEWLREHQVSAAVIVLVAAAGFMRFYKLHSLPPGLHPDEAANGVDVLNILEHHILTPFFPGNGGRESLFMYLQSIPVAILGNTTFALRVAPAIIGTLAVVATFLWAKSWFGRRTGLIAAAIMAFLPWAVTISRDGFRAGLTALMVPLVLWLFTIAIQRNSRWLYVLAGVVTGIGFYTYIAYRMLPLALLAGFLYMLLWRQSLLKKLAPGLGIAIAAAIVTVLPMGWYAAQHPGQVFGRPGGVSFTNTSLNHGNPALTLGETIVKTALMFNVRGDGNYRHNLSGQPELNIFIGIMFLLGFLITATRVKQLRYFALLAVFLAMLLPEVLTAEGIPHALRAIGAMPAVVVLAAIGIVYMLDQWNAVFPLNQPARWAGGAAMVILLILSAYQGYVQYFVAWANSPQTFSSYSEDSSNLAAFYNEQPFSGKRYAVGSGYSLLPVQYLTHKKSDYQQVDSSGLNSLNLQPGTAAQFSIFEKDKDKALKTLKVKYPKGQVSPHFSAISGEELFVVYTVPAT